MFDANATLNGSSGAAPRAPAAGPGFDPTPPSLVEPTGAIRFGVFREPLREIALHRARPVVAGHWAPAAWGRFRLKQWQHYLLVHPKIMLTFAVVDVRYLKVAWCQVVRPGAARFEHGLRSPIARMRIADALWDASTSFDFGGFHLAIHNHLAAGRHDITLDVAASKKGPAVRAHLVAEHPLTGEGRIEPLVVSLPLGQNRTMYSHKVPLPVHGHVMVGDERIDLDDGDATLVLDIHKAHYPHHTWWKWATFAGRDTAGRRVALNLTKNVIGPHPHHHENAVWVDGRLHRLSPALIAPSADGFTGAWRVGTEDGAVALTFEPTGGRREDLNAGVITSRFKQAYGTFSGVVRYWDSDDETVRTVTVERLPGLAEDHDSNW